jgi:hypothetical protein
MVNSANSVNSINSNIEQNKNKILKIANFNEIKSYNSDSEIIENDSIESESIGSESNGSESIVDESIEKETNSSRIDDTIVENENVDVELEENADENKREKEEIQEKQEEIKEEINDESLETIHSEIENSVNNPILAGGVNDDIEYTIDYILEDDIKLVDSEKIIDQVNKYIDNYNNPNIQSYKKNFKQLYQTYSNKNYVINNVTNSNNITKIIVTKNDKTKKIVKELTKPSYLYYNENDNLLRLKREISNSRKELLYKYEKIIEKIKITPDEKKEFEKERTNFIEQLEIYYIYTLYHKKINKINIENKTSITFQKEYLVFKENNEYESKILNSNIYLIDNTDIETINKYNSDNLNEYNNIIATLSSKKDAEISKDKKILEKIKSYIKTKNEIDLFAKSLLKKTDIQDNIINYIIL